VSFYKEKKRLYVAFRLAVGIWFFLSAAVLIPFSSDTAQNASTSRSLGRLAESRAEKLKPSAPPLMVDKKLFFQRASLGTVTAIRPVRMPADSQSAFWIAAERGAVSVTDSGKPRLSVRFERMGGKVTPVDMEGDGSFEFLSRSGGQEEVRLYDHEGRQLWNYGLGRDPAVRDAACGDLNGDGLMECVLAMKGDGGLRLLDRSGKELWRKLDLNIWHVEILDWDGDGRNEILHTSAAGRIRIRNADGEIVRELPGDNFVSLFSVCHWQNPDSRWFILNNNNRTGIQIIDAEGNVTASIPATAKGYEAVGTPVRFDARGQSYFALLIGNCTPRRDSHLFIYNPENEIIYEEKFLPSQAALLAVRDETTGDETLLVGEGEGRVWKYRLVPAGSKN